DEVDTRTASPFARSLVFAYVAAYMYEGDAPLAERKAQALTLDRNLLRELLGEEDLRDLLDAQAIEDVEADLQGLTRKARGADAVHDLLRRVGDLDGDEVAARAEGDAPAMLAALAGRAVKVRVGGRERWIAVEDVARYRDALGVAPPAGVAAVWLEPAVAPLQTPPPPHARPPAPFPPRAPPPRLRPRPPPARAPPRPPAPHPP